MIHVLWLLMVAGALPQSGGVQDMFGTYHCVAHGRTISHFTTKNEAYGPWLRASFSAPPQNGQPADTAITYLGFDPNAHRWNIVSVDTDGTYFTRYSTSTSLNGSQWTNGYPNDGGHAVLTIVSRSKWIFTTKGPGSRPPEQTTCNRL